MYMDNKCKMAERLVLQRTYDTLGDIIYAQFSKDQNSALKLLLLF